MKKMSQYSRPHSIAKAPFQFRPSMPHASSIRPRPESSN
jgi:hypothetical protein